MGKNTGGKIPRILNKSGNFVHVSKTKKTLELADNIQKMEIKVVKILKMWILSGGNPQMWKNFGRELNYKISEKLWGGGG